MTSILTLGGKAPTLGGKAILLGATTAAAGLAATFAGIPTNGTVGVAITAASVTITNGPAYGAWVLSGVEQGARVSLSSGYHALASFTPTTTGSLDFGVGTSSTGPLTIFSSTDIVGAAPTSTPAPTPATTPGMLPTFRVQAVVATPAQSPVSMGHLFAKGDVPAGYFNRLQATVGNATVPIQVDQTNAWPDGSLRMCSFSFLLPAAMTAGQTDTYQLGIASAALTGTPVTTAQIMAASDFKIHYSGYDHGADTFTVSANDILANFPAWNATTGWGTNPLGGWQVTRSGPICTEWRCWRMLKRDSDNASHRWVKAVLFVRAWPVAGGGYHFECLPGTMQDQAYDNGHPLGTVGPTDTAISYTTQPHYACVAELFNGTTRIAAYGGPNDPRTYSGDQTIFGGNTLPTAPPWFTDTSDGINWGGLPVAFTGPGVPSALAQNTVYFTCGPKSLSTTRADAQSYTAPIQSFGTAGSGAVTVTPISATYPGGAWFGSLPDATVPWIGNAGMARPNIMVAHDATYATRNTRVLPPYILDIAVPNYQDYANTNTFSLNRPPCRIDIESVGDNPTDQRIGYLNRHQVNLLLNPLDKGRELRVLSMGWNYADFQMWFSDPRSGTVVNCSSQNIFGPMPPNVNFLTSLRFMDVNAQGAPAWAGINFFDNCWSWAYGGLMSPAHQPLYVQMPYLRTGHWAFAEMMTRATCTMISSCDGPGRSPDGVHQCTILGVYQNSDNIRGVGWACRSMGTTDRMMPDNAPERPYVKFILDQNGEFAGTFSGVHPVLNAMGYPYYLDNAAYNETFMDAHALQGVAMEVYVGDRPGFQNLVAAQHGAIDYLDDSLGNVSYWMEDYRPSLVDTGGNFFQNIYSVYKASHQPNIAKAISSDAIDHWNPPSVDFQVYGSEENVPAIPIMMRAGVVMASWLSAPATAALRIVRDFDNRITTPPLVGPIWVGTDHKTGETDAFAVFGYAPPPDTTPAATAAPGAVTNLAPGFLAVDGFGFTYSAAPGGGPGCTYKHEYSADGGTTWITVNAALARLSSFAPNLSTAPRSLVLRVTPSNSFGTGPATTLAITLPTPAAAPSGLATSLTLAGMIKLSWQASTGISEYQVQYRLSGSTAAWTVASYATPNTAFPIYGLTASTSYDLQVTAIDANGPGNPAQITASTTAVPTTSVANDGTYTFLGDGGGGTGLYWAAATRPTVASADIGKFACQVNHADGTPPATAPNFVWSKSANDPSVGGFAQPTYLYGTNIFYTNDLQSPSAGTWYLWATVDSENVFHLDPNGAYTFA